jgi:SAM-dependent methyltransferase
MVPRRGGSLVNIASMEIRARSFNGWADEYERFRPGYPRELFDRIATAFDLPPRPAAVDLGAGTGKVSRAMAALGWHVTAVEPGPRMIEELRRAAAAEGVEVEPIVGTAEDTGLGDARFDVATAGEAWHWFDGPRALAEVARIVRPRGGFAFFWNVVDEAHSELVAAERELVVEYGVSGGDIRLPGPRPETAATVRAAGTFEEATFIQVPHQVPMTGAEYLGFARTKSHLRTAPPEVQNRFLRAFADMLRNRGIAPADRIEVPFIVDCWLARRRTS